MTPEMLPAQTWRSSGFRTGGDLIEAHSKLYSRVALRLTTVLKEQKRDKRTLIYSALSNASIN